MSNDDAGKISVELSPEQHGMLVRGVPVCVKAATGHLVSIAPPELRISEAPAAALLPEGIPADGIASAIRNQLSRFKELADAATARHT